MHKCLLNIYHTNVHTIFRPARGPVKPPRIRAIHLLHSLFSKDVPIRMLLKVREKTYPDADQVSLKLLQNGQWRPTVMTLKEALARLEPLSYLVQTEDTPGTYRILKFDNPGLTHNKKKAGPSSRRYYKRNGRSKELHTNTDCSAAQLRHKLKLAYDYLQEGSRVEFHISSKANASAETIDSELRNHLHLRPEAILATMPPGTTMLAIPGTLQPPAEALKVRSQYFINKTSDVFWAMENEEALKRHGVVTPPEIKRTGTWKGHREYAKAVIEKKNEARRRKELRAERRERWNSGSAALARSNTEKERIKDDESDGPPPLVPKSIWR